MLIAVVGPSGAGKDTLLNRARASLADDARFVFVRRVITRPRDAGGEDHQAMTAADFSASLPGFALHWAAHGLLYGIPIGIEAEMAAGRVVVANLSRAVLLQAAARYRLRVLLVTAPPSLRAARLAERQREAPADIEARLAREVPLPAALDVVTIQNDSDVETGAQRFLAALNRAAADALQSRTAGQAPPG